MTTRSDISADLVVAGCTRRGVAVFRFNSEDYPQHIGIHMDPGDPEAACLLLDDEPVEIGRARGIWLRRPQWPVITPAVSDPHDRQLAVQESVAAAGGLWRLLADRCVSAPDALQAARWKVPQLARAARLGFQVPSTLVTTSTAEARRFAGEGPTVIKALQEACVRVGSTLLTGKTERVAVESAALDEIDGVCPVLLQREVDKVADIRVTVAGQRHYAVKIVTPPGSPLDFRATAPAACEMELAELPPTIADACVRLVAESGLRFGAIDLAMDRSGSLWFLECNPNGQWGWLEPPTGAPITDAIIDVLLAEKKT